MMYTNHIRSAECSPALVRWRHLFWFLPLLLLAGCAGTVDGDTRLCWNGARGLLAVNQFSADGQPSTVRLTLFTLERTPGFVESSSSDKSKEVVEANLAEGQSPSTGVAVRAEEVGRYQGTLAGITPVGSDFLLAFSDGSLLRLQGHTLLPVRDGSNELHFLNIVGDGKKLYGLQLTGDGKLQLRVYSGSLEVAPYPGGAVPVEPQTPPAVAPGLTVAQLPLGASLLHGASGTTGADLATAATLDDWVPLGAVVPMFVPVAMAELALLQGDPVVAVRAVRANAIEPGVRLLRLEAGASAWSWLPSPPGMPMSGLLSVCAYRDGLLLMQEPGQAKGEPQQNYLGFYTVKEGWASYAPVSLIQYDRWQPAQSLTLAAGDKRAFALRIAGYGLGAFTSADAESAGWQRLLLPGTSSPSTWPVWFLPVAVFLGTMLVLRLMRGRMQAALARRGITSAPDNPENLAKALRVQVAVSASPIDRAVAMLVDMLLVSPLPVLYVGSAGQFSEEFMQGQGLAAYLLLLGALMVYSLIAEALFGQTVGKWLMRLRVRSVDGGRPTLLQLTVRNVLRVVDFFPVMIGGAMIWYLVALLSVTATRRRQRLGDFISGTLVRRVPAIRNRRVLLASASPRRRALLEELGVNFTVQKPDIDEAPVKGVAPREMAERLARRKAEVVAQDVPEDSIIIAADTVVVVDNEILGKPTDREAARAMLRRLAGREHQVITAVSVIDKATGQYMDGSDVTDVQMRELREDEIGAYVETGEADDKAGAYAIQGKGGSFVLTARGSISNVIGLPVEMLREMLRDLS